MCVFSGKHMCVFVNYVFVPVYNEKLVNVFTVKLID